MMESFGEHGWGMGLGMGWWWIIGLFLLVLVIWLIIRTANRNPQSSKSESPLDILKSRYARGEIDKEEYEKKKSELL